MYSMTKIYDVLVIGGGHAGCEAFAAAARVGVRAALLTPSLAEVAYQPCNPAVGGPGKGHLVREVVALGGLMGKVTDRTGLQFRTLNSRKGPAVRATRVQTDAALYSRVMLEQLRDLEGTLIEGRAVGLEFEAVGRKKRVRGVTLADGRVLETKAVVVTAGTFLRGMLFVGDQKEPGGRRGAEPSVRLAQALERAGLPLIRLKTGTCPRIDGATVDTTRLDPQPGDRPEPFFDPDTESVNLPQRQCYLTYTNARTHAIVRENLAKSAMYSGAITGIGPRYCPSFEAKIDRFADKPRHQVFLEPEDVAGKTVYPSGIPTSLPVDVQERMVHSIEGLERARIVRYGYAVEYDAVQPRALAPDLHVDGFEGLFLAGQILGTSGYEEAAALGLVAGANAALWARSEEPMILSRDQAYAGVMIDDLTSLGVDEPYRMFTSRAEYRLMLREDNADERLLEVGLRTGLLPPSRAERIRSKVARVRDALDRLRAIGLTPSQATNGRLAELGLPPIPKPLSLLEMLTRAGVRLGDLVSFAPFIGDLSSDEAARVEVDVKYKHYLEREMSHAEKLRSADAVRIPEGLDLKNIPGLRGEIVEKLHRCRPATLGQASRIPGVTPAAIQVLHIYCRKRSAGMQGE